MDANLAKHVKRFCNRAYFHLSWEYLAPIFAIALLCVVLFFIGSFSGLWQRIGDPWRLIALILCLVLIARAIWKSVNDFSQGRGPTRAKALRRIETDNQFFHRPFDTITDTKASVGSASPSFDINAEQWQQHVTKAEAQVRTAKPSILRPSLAPIDRFHLRFLLPICLIAAGFFGLGDLYERSRASVLPMWQSGMAAKNVTYEAWIDPPAYTGRPPRYFKTNNQASAPDGSEFVVRVSGIRTAPRLVVKSAEGLAAIGRTKRITATRLGPQSFEIRTKLLTKPHSNATQYRASITVGRSQQIWDLNIGDDSLPTIDFKDPPTANKRDRLIFTYSAQDDFGLASIALSVRLKNNTSEHDGTDTITLRPPRQFAKEISDEPASLDLTKHQWAGKEVIGVLIATDGKGQSAKSEPVEFIIPDKIFIEPLAKAVAEQRALMLAAKDIAYQPLAARAPLNTASLQNKPLYSVYEPERTILRAPSSVQRTADLIEIVTDQPVGIFDDPSVYMGLRHIYRQIKTAKQSADLNGIPENLWKIALRAEFGLLGDALADMQKAERALNNAMARHAPQREIDALFDRYNVAVDRYMEELFKKAIEEAKKKGKQGDKNGPEGGGNMQSDEIQKLLDAIEEANRLGDTVAARKALAQLAQLLERLKMQIDPNASGGGREGPNDQGMSEEMQKALEELNEILGDQRKLRDDTQSSAIDDALKQREQQGGLNDGNGNQQNPKGKKGARSSDELANSQQELQDLLAKLEGSQGLRDTLEGKTKSGSKAGEEDGEGQNGGSTGDEKSGDNGGGATGDEDNKSGSKAEDDIDIEQALKKARSAMGDAEDALNNEQYFRARRSQSEAIDALRQAGKGIYALEADKMSERDGKDANAKGGSDDPFGRENSGNGVGEDIDLPTIDNQKKARDLLNELRKRSGEQGRDETEREYLERLLKQF